MKICFVNPTSANRNWGNSFPPLGIGYLAAQAEKNGHQAIIIDRDLVFSEHNNLNLTDSYTMEMLKSAQPDIVGIGATTPLIPDSYRTAGLAKKILPKSKVVIGGIHTTILPELTLKQCSNLDYAVAGEGEITFMDIVEGKAIQQIPGLYYRNGEAILANEPRAVIDNLDWVAPPARHLLNMKKYTSKSKHLIRGVSIRGTSIFTTRGCPYSCAFCAGPLVFGKKVRFHSVEYVTSEIESLIEDFGIEGLYFADDMFSAKRDRAMAICDEMIRRKINKKLVFCVQLKVNAVDEELLKKLKEAGCIQVEFGFESGSQRILDIMNKRVKVEQNFKAAELARKTGLRFLANIITGVPGETEEDYNKTISFLKSIRADVVGFYKLILLPGSKLYLDQELSNVPQNWEAFTQDDLASNYSAIPDRKYFSLYKKDSRRIAFYNARNYLMWNLKRDFFGTIRETAGLINNKLKKKFVK